MFGWFFQHLLAKTFFYLFLLIFNHCLWNGLVVLGFFLPVCSACRLVFLSFRPGVCSNNVWKHNRLIPVLMHSKFKEWSAHVTQCNVSFFLSFCNYFASVKVFKTQWIKFDQFMWHSSVLCWGKKVKNVKNLPSLLTQIALQSGCQMHKQATNTGIQVHCVLTRQAKVSVYFGVDVCSLLCWLWACSTTRSVFDRAV